MDLWRDDKEHVLNFFAMIQKICGGKGNEER